VKRLKSRKEVIAELVNTDATHHTRVYAELSESMAEIRGRPTKKFLCWEDIP
jgi:hypothetical protein